jgi:hypothetical protein
MLVCWQAYWNYRDHSFPEYEQIVACLKDIRWKEIPETLIKEFSHVNESPRSQNMIEISPGFRG